MNIWTTFTLLFTHLKSARCNTAAKACSSPTPFADVADVEHMFGKTNSAIERNNTSEGRTGDKGLLAILKQHI